MGVNERWLDDAGVAGLVSVVVPTYNRAEVLVEALDSIAGQTHRPLEIVVVDDGSSDGTAGRVRGWAEGHEGPDLSLHYHHQENRGARRRNAGRGRRGGSMSSSGIPMM